MALTTVKHRDSRSVTVALLSRLSLCRGTKNGLASRYTATISLHLALS